MQPCLAQFSSSNEGYSAVGTYSRHFTDVFSFCVNQASLSEAKNTVAGIFSERRFMLKELTIYSAAIAKPMLSGGMAITADFTGNKDYSQTKIGLAYGRALGEKLALGIQFNYNRMHISGYGNAGSVDVEIGSILHLTEKLHAGWHVYNPFVTKAGHYSTERFPSVYTIGLGYEVTEQLLINTVVEKEENRPVKVNVAMHYALMKQFFLRGGIASAEGLSFIGAGISWKNFRTDAFASWHPRLGFSPSLLLVFTCKKEEQASND